MSQHCDTFKGDSMEGSLFIKEETLGMPGFKESYQLDLLALGDPVLSPCIPHGAFDLYSNASSDVLGVEPSYLADWCSQTASVSTATFGNSPSALDASSLSFGPHNSSRYQNQSYSLPTSSGGLDSIRNIGVSSNNSAYQYNNCFPFSFSSSGGNGGLNSTENGQDDIGTFKCSSSASGFNGSGSRNGGSISLSNSPSLDAVNNASRLIASSAMYSTPISGSNHSIPYMSSHSDSFTEYFDCAPCPSFGPDVNHHHQRPNSSSSSPKMLQSQAGSLQQQQGMVSSSQGDQGAQSCVGANNVQKSDVTNNELAQFNTLVGEMAGVATNGSNGNGNGNCGVGNSRTAAHALGCNSACPSMMLVGNLCPNGNGTASRTPTKSADGYFLEHQHPIHYHSHISLGLDTTPSTSAETPTNAFVMANRLNANSLSCGAGSSSSSEAKFNAAASESQDCNNGNGNGNAALNAASAAANAQEQKSMDALLSNRYIRELGILYDAARMEAPPAQDIKVFVRNNALGDRARALELIEEVKNTQPIATSVELNEIIIKSGNVANWTLANSDDIVDPRLTGHIPAITITPAATTTKKGVTTAANAASTSGNHITSVPTASSSTFGQSYLPVVCWDNTFECYDVFWYMADKTGKVTSRVCRFLPSNCGSRNQAYDEAVRFAKYVENVVRPGDLIKWYPGFNIPIGTNGRTNLRKVLHMDRMKNSEQCDPVLEANGLKIATKSTFGDMTIVELYKAAYVLGLWDVAATNCLRTCKRRGYLYEWIHALASKNKRVTLDALKYLRNVKEATLSKRRAQDGCSNPRQKKKASY